MMREDGVRTPVRPSLAAACALVLTGCCALPFPNRDDPAPPSPLPRNPAWNPPAPPSIEPAPTAQEIPVVLEAHPVTFRYAYAVFHGGRSFRVHLSGRHRGCEWARAGGIGVVRDDDAHLTLDVAPVVTPEGTRWSVVGAGWVTGRALGRALGNLGFDRFDAAVEAPDDATRRVHPRIAHDALRFDAPFDAVVCSPPRDPEQTAPMTIELGDERYGLTRAWLQSGPPGGERIRIARNLEPCQSTVTHEDVFVDITSGGPIAAATSLNVAGRVVDRRHSLLRERERVDLRIEGTPPDERLVVDETRDVYEDRLDATDPLRVRIHGELPLTRCPPGQ